MTAMKPSLIKTLQLSDSRIITLVGAGGKTSLMYALAKEMSETKKTLLTTTTHIMEPSDLPGVKLVTMENRPQLLSAFEVSNLVALGLPLCGRKWSSPSLSFLESIRDIPSRILCEGDGSRRLPVKIPREKEPVFFPGTDTVIGVIGLSCLHRPAADCLFGLSTESFPGLKKMLKRTDGLLTSEILFTIALSSYGLQKNVGARQYRVVLNQADCLSSAERPVVWHLAQKIRDNGVPCFVVSLKDNVM